MPAAATGNIAANLAPLVGKKVQIELVSQRAMNHVLLVAVNTDNIIVYGPDIIGDPGVSNPIGKMIPFTAISVITGSQS